MRSETNTKLSIRLHLINRIIDFILAFTVIMQLSACNGTTQKEVKNESTVFTEFTETNVTFETTSNAISDNAAGTVIEANDIVASGSDELISFLNNFDERFYAYVSFYDFNLDGHEELFYASEVGIGRSFDTVNYEIYTLENTVPEFYGTIRLEIANCNSNLTEHTFCQGKLQRFFDPENKIYIIIGDETLWDDGDFGNIQYYSNKYCLFSNKIVGCNIGEFSGTPCIPAQYIRENKVTDYSYIDEWDFVYFNDVLDLNSTEKFVDISDVVENLEFVDTIDLNSLPQYQDIDEIAEHILEYSGYENTNEVSAPDDDNEYIGIVGMGNHKICKSDKDISIEISEITDIEWEKILEINDLHSLVLHYYGDEVIDIDLLSLKKYQNLTSISLPENISESTKLQISELTTLEYVNKWSIIISSEKDFEYLKNLPNLKYIAVSSDNDDPDYFKFLYENQSIEWIRFAESVTDEQIKQIVDNMPNLKAVTFGFSEV